MDKELLFKEGVWESVKLNPTVIIVRKAADNYVLMIIYMNEDSKQAQPAIFDIEEDERGYYIGLCINQQRIEYNPETRVLHLSVLGDYLPN